MFVFLRILGDIFFLLKKSPSLKKKYYLVLFILSTISVVEIGVIKLLINEVFNGSYSIESFTFSDGGTLYLLGVLLLSIEAGRFWAKTKNIKNINEVIVLFKKQIGYTNGNEGWHRALLIEVHVFLTSLLSSLVLLLAMFYLIGNVTIGVFFVILFSFVLMYWFFSHELKNQSIQGEDRSLISKKVESRIFSAELASFISTLLLYVLLVMFFYLYLLGDISLELLVITIFAVRILSSSIRVMSASLMRSARAIVRSKMFVIELDVIFNGSEDADLTMPKDNKTIYVNRYRELRKERIRLKKRNSQLVKQNEIIRKRLVSVKERHKELKEKISFLNMTIRNFKKTKERYAAMLSGKRITLAAKQKTEKMLRQNIANRKKDINRLQEENSKLRSLLDD